MLSLIVLVFIETQDPTLSHSTVLERAAEEALGPGASVSVRAIQPGTPDTVLAALGQERGAWAVARVVWGDTKLDARLDVSLIRSRRRLALALDFLRFDPLVERWRALGLVLASTITKDAAAHPDETRREVPPAGVVAASAVAAPTPLPRWALDLGAEAGLAFGGADIGGGGTIGLRWLRSPRIGFRVGFRARFAEINEAQGTVTALAGTAGVIFAALPPRPDSHLSVSARLDAMVLDEIFSHFSSDDAARAREGRLLAGASAVAEARWALGPALGVTVAAGPELALGTTHIYVGTKEVAHLSPLRAVLQVGVTASF